MAQLRWLMAWNRNVKINQKRNARTIESMWWWQDIEDWNESILIHATNECLFIVHITAMDGSRWLLLPKWFITSVIKSSKLMMNSISLEIGINCIQIRWINVCHLKCMCHHVHLKLQFDLGISVWNARISIRIFAFDKSKIDEKVVTNFVILFFWCGMWRCLEFRLCHIYLKNNRTASIDKKGEEKNEMRPVWVCVRNIFKDKCWKLNR